MTEETTTRRSTSKAEPMDWSPTKSESSLPSPVRSRSRSVSPPPSPPRAITINLFPLSDSIEFAPKHLSFNPDQEIKVGRVSGSRNQKEAKPDNGVFSCDVMSREHALLKEENGKILIKDLKSTHGTFVNNVRLGDGTEESDWRTLNHRDVITFGHSVRRNQNLYKHLSAYIFYPKETKEDIYSPPSTSNGATPITAPIVAPITTPIAAPISAPTSNPSTIKVERASDNVLSTSSVVAQEVTSVSNAGVSQSSMPQRSEGPASYYIAKSGGLPSAASSATNPLVGGLSVTKPRTTTDTDNVTQANESKAHITELKQVGTSNTSEEMLTSIQKLKIGQSDEKSHIESENKARSVSQEDNNDISMENDENVKDLNNAKSGHKSEITLDNNPIATKEETTTVTQAPKTTVSFVAPAPVKDRLSTQVARETKQPKASRREKESNIDRGENVSNGEGPSHVTEDDSPVAIPSRKRKYEEVDEEVNGQEEVNDLKEKLAELEERARTANKRRKWDMVYSTAIGMAAGAVGIGACAYMFGM